MILTNQKSCYLVITAKNFSIIGWGLDAKHIEIKRSEKRNNVTMRDSEHIIELI
jgi:hypothetical protein